ncbi:MAG: ABC transporter substrate-binding protein [Rhizobiaceae bacterium]|nr:ABC transporter substrate-binding protein [Rhizobiaceae bacterium]
MKIPETSIPLALLKMLVCVGVVLSASTMQSLAQPFKVGVSVPLSGNAAPLGRQYAAGARLAMELLPDTSNIEIIISDDGCDKDLAELAVDDIRAAGAVLIAGYLCNEPVYTAADMLRGANIPILISAARSVRILKDRERESWNVWQMAPRDTDVSRAAFEVLSQRWKSTPYAIVDDGTIFGRTMADEFRALMEEAGNKPQFVDNFRPAQSTQAGLIRRLSRAGVDAVFLAASAQDVALIGRNMIEFGPNIEIATGEAVSLLPYIDDNKGIPVGLLAIMPSPPEELDQVSQIMEKIEKAGLEPEPYLLLGYATIQVVVGYFGEAGQSFAGKRFSTILGDVEFDANGKNITTQYQLYRWNGKTFTRAQ